MYKLLRAFFIIFFLQNGTSANQAAASFHSFQLAQPLAEGFLALAEEYGKNIQIMNFKNNVLELEKEIAVGDSIDAITSFHNGSTQFLAVALNTNQIKLFDLKSGVCTRTIATENGQISAITVFREGDETYLAAGIQVNFSEGIIQVWSLDSEQPGKTIKQIYPVSSLAAYQQGRKAYLVAGYLYTNAPIVWEVSTATVVRQLVPAAGVVEGDGIMSFVSAWKDQFLVFDARSYQLFSKDDGKPSAPALVVPYPLTAVDGEAKFIVYYKPGGNLWSYDTFTKRHQELPYKPHYGDYGPREKLSIFHASKQPYLLISGSKGLETINLQTLENKLVVKRPEN